MLTDRDKQELFYNLKYVYDKGLDDCGIAPQQIPHVSSHYGLSRSSEGFRRSWMSPQDVTLEIATEAMTPLVTEMVGHKTQQIEEAKRVCPQDHYLIYIVNWSFQLTVGDQDDDKHNPDVLKVGHRGRPAFVPFRMVVAAVTHEGMPDNLEGHSRLLFPHPSNQGES